MEVYVITVLEEWMDGNFAYTCDTCSHTLEGAKKLLTKYVRDLTEMYKTDMDAHCKITKDGEMLTTITINDDMGTATLEIHKTKITD